jgi:predicted O-methyltransferase YrrM
VADLVLHPEKRADTGYVPSYRLGEAFVNEEHRKIGEVVADVPGWLRPEDELKLYELAYFAPGPILEIGTYRGRSTTIMARAAQAGAGAMLFSVDVDPSALRAGSAALSAHGVAHRVVLVRGSAGAALRRLAGLRPSLTFVDGDHSLGGVRRDLAAIEPAVPQGGLVLFHDFQDARNDDPAIAEIAVREGVEASWVARECDFAGVFGCCGLFRRRVGGPAAAGPPTVDAVSRDAPRMQYLQRVRWPLGRVARRLLGRPRP